jgi:hypothetical protein
MKEKQETKAASRVDIKFKNFKVHSEDLNSYFDSDEPTNRVKAESDGTQNKADIAFRQMVDGDTFPNYKNAGLRKNVDRRYK